MSSVRNSCTGSDYELFLCVFVRDRNTHICPYPPKRFFTHTGHLPFPPNCSSQIKIIASWQDLPCWHTNTVVMDCLFPSYDDLSISEFCTEGALVLYIAVFVCLSSRCIAGLSCPVFLICAGETFSEMLAPTRQLTVNKSVRSDRPVNSFFSTSPPPWKHRVALSRRRDPVRYRRRCHLSQLMRGFTHIYRKNEQ